MLKSKPTRKSKSIRGDAKKIKDYSLSFVHFGSYFRAYIQERKRANQDLSKSYNNGSWGLK